MRAINSTVWWRVGCLSLASLFIVFTFNFALRNEDKKPDNKVTTFYVQKQMSIDNNCNVKHTNNNSIKFTNSLPLWEQDLDFDQLSYINQEGSPDKCYLVPNYIHFIQFGDKPLIYFHMICYLAAFKNQKPEKIFMHYNNKTTFTGKYWRTLEQTAGFMDIVEFHYLEPPDEIYGQKLNPEWRNWHGSDIARIRMIQKYGGIFLDNDCYLVRNIDSFRRYEIAMSWDENQLLGNQIIVAHKNARFLKIWMNSYHEYDGSQWYYNAGRKPTEEILEKMPNIIHRVKVWFGIDPKFKMNMFQEEWEHWREFYILHLLMRHQSDLVTLRKYATYPVEFNEENIAYYPITFRDMAYDVYDIANIKWPKAKLDPPSLFDVVNFI